MFAQLPESRMHWVRWFLTIAWLLIIASLFYDPWTPALTEPNHPWSPLRLTNTCVHVQGECIAQQPYPLGTTLFWSVIVPAAIFILLVFGHELWRRICPLSFLSQIPRALGWQRHVKRQNKQTGQVRAELVTIKPNSWLGQNYRYVQFGWLFVGLCGRLLFFNADRIILGGWLIFTIVAAIAVGYLYEGKSWCQYFCPMAPVQTIFSEPGGLLGSQAHLSDQPITQSMCRTALPDGHEQSTCVACQNPCLDIDAERTYWESINKPETSLIRYGYVGLVIGYFGYSYFYAGNWDYYFSGVWLHHRDPAASLLNPGLYLFGQAINIPKLVAVPLVLGSATGLGYWGGRWIETRVKLQAQQYAPKRAIETIRHRVFTLGTFGIFNFFFIFAGHPLINLLPRPFLYLYDLSLVLFSSLWLNKTWPRSADHYSRENLASRFRKRLEKLALNVSEFLEGRSLSDLNADEVYILAKVLPDFTADKRLQAYKDVLQEALEEGYVSYSSSLEILQHMREELKISDDDHRFVLDQLGIEDPELLNPNRQRSLENQIRLSGFRKSLERLMRLYSQQADLNAFEQLSSQDPGAIRSLRRNYAITTEEETWILSGYSAPAGNVKKAEYLLQQLSQLIESHCALNQPRIQDYQAVLTLLREHIIYKKELIVRSLLETLVLLQDDASAPAMAQALQQASPSTLVELFEQENWRDRLPAAIVQTLTQPGETPVSCSLSLTNQDILRPLEILLVDLNPLVKAAALYTISQLDAGLGLAIAHDQLRVSNPLPVQETAELLVSSPHRPLPLSAFPMLEKLVYLFNSDFFRRTRSNTLIALANRAQVKTYNRGEMITEAGDTCRELLLLIEGRAIINYQAGTNTRSTDLQVGQVLDELEVFANSTSESSIVADSEIARMLTIPVDTFDDFLLDDPDFARRVLALERRQIQRFVPVLPRQDNR